MQVWAFVSQKGGVGKTTLALHLAVYAEEQGRMTAVLDCDPQTNCVRWAKERGTREPMVFATAPEKLGETIEAARTLGVDLCIIDAASKLDAPLLAAVACADRIVTPTSGGLLNIDSLEATAKLLAMAGRLQDAVAVVNNVEQGKAESTVGEARAALDRLSFPMCPVHLCHRPPFETAINAGRGITESNPKSPGADELRKLWAALNQATAVKKLKKVV